MQTIAAKPSRRRDSMPIHRHFLLQFIEPFFVLKWQNTPAENHRYTTNGDCATRGGLRCLVSDRFQCQLGLGRNLIAHGCKPAEPEGAADLRVSVVVTSRLCRRQRQPSRSGFWSLGQAFPSSLPKGSCCRAPW